MKWIIKKSLFAMVWLISLLGIFLFLGVFREGLSLIEIIVLSVLCVFFGVAPWLMGKFESLNAIVINKSNMVILGLGSLMFIYCISESFYYEFLSKEGVIAWIIGIISLMIAISIVRSSSPTENMNA